MRHGGQDHQEPTRAHERLGEGRRLSRREVRDEREHHAEVQRGGASPRQPLGSRDERVAAREIVTAEHRGHVQEDREDQLREHADQQRNRQAHRPPRTPHHQQHHVDRDPDGQPEDDGGQAPAQRRAVVCAAGPQQWPRDGDDRLR
jgi:hypothetical protein